MAIAVVFLVCLLAVPPVYAANHIVGDTNGWSQGVNFASWVSGKKFVVGDNLVFNYGSPHSVDQINQADYTSCTTSNAIKSYKGGKTSVPLKVVGPMYFLCPTVGHCAGGMKLSISVLAAAAAPATPSSSSPPKTGTPPSTPSTSKKSRSKSNGASGAFGDMNKLVGGLCLVFLGVVGLMSRG